MSWGKFIAYVLLFAGLAAAAIGIAVYGPDGNNGGEVVTYALVGAALIAMLRLAMTVRWPRRDGEWSKEECLADGGHVANADGWRDTSGRGRYATCRRCNESMYEPEWS